MARKARPYWSCPSCKYRNERLKRKCLSCGKTKPKRRVPAHAKTLRDDGYEHYVEVARILHGVEDERCCVCGKPRNPERRHDRDHSHVSGFPRGLACGGNKGCNALMPYWLTAERARQIAAYLDRAEQYPKHFTKPEDHATQRPEEG